MMARHLKPGGALIVERCERLKVLEDGQIWLGLINEPDLLVVRMSSAAGQVVDLDMHHMVTRNGRI